MNYKKAYFKLFNELTTIIERLKEIQCEAEEIVISENKKEAESESASQSLSDFR